MANGPCIFDIRRCGLAGRLAWNYAETRVKRG